MFNLEEIKTAFKSFVEQTSTSSFKLDFDSYAVDYHISLNYDIEGKTILNNDAFPLVKISNLNLFLAKLLKLSNLMASFHNNDKIYFDFSKDSFLKYLLLSFFSNMNEFDYNNPLSYIDKMTIAYCHNYYIGEEKLAGNILVNSELINIYEQSAKNIATMESPLYKQFIFKNRDYTYVSPKIHYYIANNVVFITGIQNSKKKNINPLSKKLDRYFRKVDAGLEDVEKSEDKVLTIKDISPSFLVALTLFISSFKEYNNFCLIDYLPLKYHNRIGVLKAKNIDIEEANKIQTNVTNKFILTGERFCEHFDNADFYYINGFFNIYMEQYEQQYGNIIYDIYESLNKSHINENNKKI